MKRKAILLICGLVAILCPAAIGKIIYIDDDATGANDGSSWENAYIYLQDALADAEAEEKPVEIRVAQGIYKPDLGVYQIQGDNRFWHSTFFLINDVALSGGYAGVNEPDPNERNVELYESILSGDLNGDDIEVEDPCDLYDEPTREDNSFSVVSSYLNDANAVIDGFTIRGGFFNGFIDPGPTGGGGMHIYRGSPTIIDCTFTGNATQERGGYGGGIVIYNGSPTLVNCTFTKNSARSGGGICIQTFRAKANPTFINCVFSNNYSTSDGAGMFSWYGGNIVLLNCTFTGNISESSGGGLYSSGIVELNNCTLSNNSAITEGGGIALSEYSQLVTINNSIFTGNRVLGTQSSLGSGGACSLSGDDTTITNSTFYGNRAKQNSTIVKSSSSILNISNCIVWDGQDAISDSNSSTLMVSYSDIQGGWEGQGNIDVNPLFANPGYWAEANDPNIIAEPNDPNAVWIEGDYRLKSQEGRYDPNSESWVIDDVTSPCIDAGDPNSPIGYEPYPNGGLINMGAYGGTLEASLSPNDVNGFGLSYNPYPVDGATETGLNVILNWKSDGWPYEIYFGTSEYPPFIQKQSEKEFDPGILEPDTKYYWRVDVIDYEGDRTIGDIWSFRTQEYLIVDDFERYTDEEPDRIWDTWKDGYFEDDNGSLIGYTLDDFGEGYFMELEIVHSGNQSVVFYYNYYTNNEDFSEVKVDTNDLIIGSDWTIYNPETLVVWFYGYSDNPAIDQLYFKLNGAEVIYEGDLNNFLLPEWWSWEMNVDDFEQDLSYIETITIGVRREAPADREGIVFLDDIRLY